MGTLVKVTKVHGAKADILTPSGDPVTVRRAYLHMVVETPSSEPTPMPRTIATVQPPVVAMPTPFNPSLSPNQTGGSDEKAKGAGTASSGETARRTVPVRCSHLTKKGEQCTRMTTSPNGLCWQHGGD